MRVTDIVENLHSTGSQNWASATCPIYLFQLFKKLQTNKNSAKETKSSLRSSGERRTIVDSDRAERKHLLLDALSTASWYQGCSRRRR